jgi:hypothetical protein
MKLVRMAEESKVKSWERRKLFSSQLRPTMPIQREPVFSTGVERPGRDSYHLFQSSVDVKKDRKLYMHRKLKIHSLF